MNLSRQASKTSTRTRHADGKGVVQTKIRRLRLNEITPADYNPRLDLKPDDPRYVALVKSMDEFGLVQPLVYNRRTKTLVGGHQRLKVLLARGETHAEAVIVDLSPEKERALNLALNKVSGSWDKEKLAELLDELVKVPEFDLQVTGFQLPEVEQLLEDLANPEASESDFDIESALGDPAPAITQPGDLIELGRHGEHRLLCGDATNRKDILRVLGTLRAHLLHADPPYGVSYDPSQRQKLPGKRAKSGATAAQRHPRNGRLINDDLPPAQYAAWLEQVCDQLAATLRPGSSIYLWNAHRQFGRMGDLLATRGFHIGSVITWAKESGSFGFSDYSEQTEFCLYGWRKGAPHRWYGPKNETTLWTENRDRTSQYRHPTQKALALAERAIRNSSQPGDIVWDPFLGSGTTLIAAARLGRRGFGLEIDPKYCDVIVRRYMALAGEKAVRPKVAERYRLRSQK